LGPATNPATNPVVSSPFLSLSCVGTPQHP
jgi:hypothetical protein